MSIYRLDKRDLEILKALMRDARKSYSELAEELGLPRSTVQEKVKRMLEKGYIKSFTAIPDYSKLGKPATAFVLISFTPMMDISQRELASMIAKMENVYEVHLISGQWDMILKVRAGSTEEVGRLVVDNLRGIKNISKTETCFVFHTAKEIP
ncbi:MAG: Lrp/AsnC family transcriptional regulator [Halobacteria archaeon]